MTDYTKNQMKYAESVDGKCHASAFLMLGELDKELEKFERLKELLEWQKGRGDIYFEVSVHGTVTVEQLDQAAMDWNIIAEEESLEEALEKARSIVEKGGES